MTTWSQLAFSGLVLAGYLCIVDGMYLIRFRGWPWVGVAVFAVGVALVAVGAGRLIDWWTQP